MARNDVGKWVARAGATGGGRTYRGQRPSNWYAIVAIIVVLGIVSVVYSDHEYRQSASSSATTTQPPKTGTTWSAGLAIDICGTKETPPLPSNQTTSKKKKQSFYTTGNGVIAVSPQNSSDAGKNATFGKFVSAYKGLVITGTTFTYPVGKKPVTYHNGEACPKGTPDQGKVGQVMGWQWGSFLATKTKGSSITGNFAGLRFNQNQEISIGFVPAGTKLPKPGGKTVEALLNAANGTSATAATPSGSVPVQTTVTPPSSLTTTPTATPSTIPAVTTPTAATKHSSKSSHKKA